MVAFARLKPKTLERHLLAAAPHLTDPNFAHTVVLILHHSRDGAFGVVLNRPIKKRVKAFLEQLTEQPCPVDLPVHFGGPVPSQLMAVHDDKSLAEIEAIPGVYLAARSERIQQLVEQAQHHFLLFIGYVGWGPGQLDQELARGNWLTAPATTQQVFHADDHDLWRDMVRQIGRAQICSMLNVKHAPQDPSLN